MEPSKQSAKLSSGEITYFVAGDGHPLLYLHPGGGVRWTKVHDGLAKSFKVYAPVMPGFDGTPTHASINSMQSAAKLAGEFVDTVIKGNCDVVGQSFGGWVALWLAALRPDRVEHLVLEAPAGFRPKNVGGLPSDPAELRKALFAHPEKLSPNSKPIEVEAANRKMLDVYNAHGETDEELLGRLGSIDKLTLILHGSLDKIIPADSVRLLRAKLSRSFLVYVWDAAHNLEIDQPERTLGVMESFLKRSEGFMVNWGSLAVNAG
jgi:pimeloyl-ACP methyl ester carboxylesterase